MAKNKSNPQTVIDSFNTKWIPPTGANQPKVGFSRIKSWGGDKNVAVTTDGLRVERQEFLWAEGYSLVKTCPYELHFIYEDKSKKKGRWAYMCTCGSIAGIISWNEIKSLVTITGEHGYVLACIAHTSTKQNTGVGRHADGSTE